MLHDIELAIYKSILLCYVHDHPIYL